MQQYNGNKSGKLKFIQLFKAANQFIWHGDTHSDTHTHIHTLKGTVVG